MSEQEKLIDLSRRFIALIDHPEPGLATWHIAVQDIVNQIADVSAKLKRE